MRVIQAAVRGGCVQASTATGGVQSYSPGFFDIHFLSVYNERAFRNPSVRASGGKERIA